MIVVQKSQKVVNYIVKLKKYFSSSAQKCMNLQAQYGCHNYDPLPVVIAKGEGIYLYDTDNTRYYDFLSAYSAVNQGHCHPKIGQAFIEQAKTLTLTSRAVYNNMLGQVYNKLHQMFGYEMALMMNSGVQAGQSAIKLARKWGYQVKKVQQDKASVLFAKGNFWGRTIAACGSSDDPFRYRNFGPFKGLQFELIDYGSTESLRKALQTNPNIVAFMVQPIQGERGVIIPPVGYLKQCQQILQKHNALLIADEIQTGLGRTGKLLCSQYDEVRPDIVLLGKALSGGYYPISAVLCDKHIMSIIKPGQHGSTYGGNPLAARTAIAALDVIKDEKLCENSYKLGEILKNRLDKIIDQKLKKQVRGRGLFVGVEFKDEKSAKKFSLQMLKNGVIAKITQSNIIRFAPPLIIKQQQLNDALDKIQKAFQNTKQQMYKKSQFRK